MKIFWLGHSAFRIEFGDTVLLTDPFLTGNPSFAESSYAGDVAKATEGCTHIALTHGHNDHVGDTLAIIEATGATLIANAEICDYLSRKASSPIKAKGGNSGGTIDLGEFTLTLVQAIHSSSYVEEDGTIIYMGNPNGFIINAMGASIYHMGDTDVFGDMELINRLYHPDVGIVPIGDNYTMGGQSAAFACKQYFDFELVIPCHYKTFGALDQRADTFVNAMKESSTKVAVLEVGEKYKIR
ncbi:MAG: metal-dependent hydrolase [Hyphomicrobiales bacterium]|nr:MAG: metal-dependent hydrolase [Hyphomicrobiales bacterium]